MRYNYDVVILLDIKPLCGGEGGEKRTKDPQKLINFYLLAPQNKKFPFS